LHHKTYERLGEETDEDLELLCVTCHEKADKDRAEDGKRRSRAALYDAQLNGWASKKYGDDWYEYMDECDVAEEFDEWVESRSDYW
jgi:hypothetical protein